MKLLLIISLLIQSAFGLNVKTLKDISTYKGTATQIFVQAAKEGGLFWRDGVGVADGGVIIKDGAGRLWRREYDISKGVNVWWWGAKGDGIQDDLPAFKAMTKFCSVWFTGENPIEKFHRPGINIGDGLYRLKGTWKIGGQSVSATDALKYEWYDQNAPSHNMEEHARNIAGTLPISIKCSNRAFLWGDFEAIELTPVVSYGCYGYVYGGYEVHSAVIEGLKIAGKYGYDFSKTGMGTNQVGLLMEGSNWISMKGCTMYGLQEGIIQNSSYGNLLMNMGFRNCERGYYSIGAHSTTGWGWIAYHCKVGYEIKSGASVYNQLNTEECNTALIVGGGFNTFNGLYFEISPQIPDSTQYQLQIGYNDEGFPVMGTTVSGMTIAGPYGVLMNKTARGLDISGSNFVSSGTKTTDPRNTIYIKNSYTDVQGVQLGQIFYPFGKPTL